MNISELIGESVYETLGLFSVHKYELDDFPGKESRTTIGLGYNKDTKLTFRVPKSIEHDWEERLLEEGVIAVYFSKVFSIKDIKGDISLEGIIRDGIPINESLNQFFAPDKNSKYYGKVRGLHGGKINIVFCNESIIDFYLNDENKERSITGKYSLRLREDNIIDDWNHETSMWSLRHFLI